MNILLFNVRIELHVPQYTVQGVGCACKTIARSIFQCQSLVGGWGLFVGYEHARRIHEYNTIAVIRYTYNVQCTILLLFITVFVTHMRLEYQKE